MALNSPPYDSQTYTVVNVNDSGVGSLRWAINQANASIGFDIIEFNIPGGGVKTIDLTSAPLPAISDPVWIDGYTQPGATEATEASAARLMIQIGGGYLPTDPVWNVGLVLLSSGSTIRGLSMYAFENNCIHIETDLLELGNVSNNTVEGNHIGLNSDATDFRGTLANGIFIGGGATGNLIGGDEPAERNVISGGNYSGVEIHGTGTSGNTVSGNRIGTDGSGEADLGNWWHGVRIYGGAPGNTIGGDSAAEGNLISGNARSGVQILGPGTDNNIVAGNITGLNSTGDAAIGNDQPGVILQATTTPSVGGPQGSVIGGDSLGERNIISGNKDHGVLLTRVGTEGNIVSGNYIGLTAGGTLGWGNLYDGVRLEAGAAGNTVGGDTVAERNIISANGHYGVTLTGAGTEDNTVSGNYIGTDPAGMNALGNGYHGIWIENGAADNIIGGTTTAEGNLISGNSHRGIQLEGTGTTGTVISANAIGVDSSGTLPLPNGYGGIRIWGPAGNMTIGGPTSAQGNVIGGNAEDGIDVRGASGILIRGNYIGVDRGRTIALGSGDKGVDVHDGAADNTIGPGNVIMHNADIGVQIVNDTTIRNVVTQNILDMNGAIAAVGWRRGKRWHSPAHYHLDHSWIRRRCGHSMRRLHGGCLRQRAPWRAGAAVSWHDRGGWPWRMVADAARPGVPIPDSHGHRCIQGYFQVLRELLGNGP
ncbi:MAG: right-handed parallel beta-helix repeat-containing protein [Chloroflexi bacterium]|nr:right-handed parallel beta-helix repeat-containing protein [Chloroflexota bacterium]